MAAALAKGTTRLENAAKEPEVVNLADTLIAMGAKIKGAGTDVVTIEGVDSLKPCEVNVIPDRIEAGTFIIAAGITGGDVIVEGCDANHLDALIMKLKETGITIEAVEGGLRVQGAPEIRSVDVKTLAIPGVPDGSAGPDHGVDGRCPGLERHHGNDLRKPFHARGGASAPGRQHCRRRPQCNRQGSKEAQGSPRDGDGSAGLGIARCGRACSGRENDPSRVYHIDRGYQAIEKKLTAIGANIRRVKG